jgi:hypothetical protein
MVYDHPPLVFKKLSGDLFTKTTDDHEQDACFINECIDAFIGATT